MQPSSRLLLLGPGGVPPLGPGPEFPPPGRAIEVGSRDVPVFIAMDARGTPVVATPGGGEPVVGLFLRRGTANGFLEPASGNGRTWPGRRV